MKGNCDSVIIGVLIFGILGIVYVFANKSHSWGYEGFQGGLDYSPYPKTENVDNYTGAMIGGNSKLECKRVPGYNGVYCPPSENVMFDPFYNTSSSMTCEGSGLYKGSGNVCLNADQHRLLTTRGGNAIG